MAAEPTRAALEAALQALHRNGLLASVATLDEALLSPTASKLLRMHACLNAVSYTHLTLPTNREV